MKRIKEGCFHSGEDRKLTVFEGMGRIRYHQQ